MLTKFSAKLHTFYWNSNFIFGKFQYFNVFIGNYEIIVLLDSQNRAISSLTACIFQTNGLFPSEFQSWNGIVEKYHYGT